MRRLVFLAVAVAIAGTLAVTLGTIARAEPDTFAARVRALASLESLNAELLGSRSATRTLETWCAVHAMAADPKIVAIRLDGPEKPPTEAQRRRLEVGPGEAVKYRHVQLKCGERLLSEADNWYVPARLTPAMNQALETTDTPFGKVIAPLEPTRQTFAAAVLWTVLPPGWEIKPQAPDHPGSQLAVPTVLFEHQAILLDGQRRPFCEVDEHYMRDVLSFAQP